MNAGAYGGETKDILIEARAVDRSGNIHVLSNADMKYSYRHCGAPDDLVFTQALFQGRAGDPAEISAAMDKITQSNAAGAEESAAGAKELDALASSLSGIVGQLLTLVGGQRATDPSGTTGAPRRGGQRRADRILAPV